MALSSPIANRERLSRLKAIRAVRKKANAPPPRQFKVVSKHRKPDDMTLEEWQIALRQESGREQSFKVRNIGNADVFSVYTVTNPQTGGSYEVSIRGELPGDNHCSCPDFSINTLGTCKHIENVLSRIKRRGGGRKALKAGFQPDTSELSLRYGGKREVVFRPARNFPSESRHFAEKYFDRSGLLIPGLETRLEEFLEKLEAQGQRVYCHDDVRAFLAQKRDQLSLSKRVDAAFPHGIHSRHLDKLLKTSLYDYQKEGALFAASQGRTLIADDMGLGKTIQAIAASEILASLGFVERVLIISPTSLKHQWRQEIQKFSERQAEIVEGPLELRATQYRAQSFYKITNYDVIHRDLALIERWSPDLIILDEAQRIKNWKTKAAQSVKKLKSPYAIVLTGTPLENRLEELHSLVEFVDRFRLGPLFRFLAEHEIRDPGGKVTGYHNLSTVKQTLGSILIRRKKEDVLKQLPGRLEKRFFVPMTIEQSNYHEESRDTVARLVHKWRRFHFLSDSDQLRLRIALQRMRMSCNSTYLLDRNTDFGVKADELMATLSDILEEDGTKVVIFSQWVLTHEILIKRLKAAKRDYVFFHGGVPSKQRGELIARFKEDPRCRIFLSTDAGGVGLNLQNASVVINMDQPWNPAVLEQRIGRVHRLGQRKPVRVVHFISQGTIEEGMLGLLSFKRSMFSGVLDGGESTVHLGQSKMNRFMETVEKATISIPQPMPAEKPQPAPEPDRPPRDDSRERAATEKSLSEMLALGASFLGELSAAIAASPEKKTAFMTRDENGQAFLRIPLPDENHLREMMGMLSSFLKR